MTNNLLAKINLILDKKNSPRDILFFSGTGISAPDPCSFPLGQELHRILLLYYTDMTNWEIDDFLQRNLPFELTVSIILEAFGGINHLNQPFNLLTDIFILHNNEMFKQENDYHKFFRKHIQQNGKHFTVNLDQFIELGNQGGIQILTTNRIDNEIFNQNNFNNIGYLYKIHGDPNIDAIGLQGFLHQVIQSGFSQRVQHFFDAQINSVKTIIFVGYGGVDQFDITPYFANKTNCFFKTTTALWINYSRDNFISIAQNISASQQEILSKFSRWLAVKCSPEIILNNLFSNGVPVINTADRNNGYRREYETFFRINTTAEIFDNLNLVNADNIRNFMLRRRTIRENLLN